MTTKGQRELTRGALRSRVGPWVRATAIITIGVVLGHLIPPIAVTSGFVAGWLCCAVLQR